MQVELAMDKGFEFKEWIWRGELKVETLSHVSKSLKNKIREKRFQFFSAAFDDTFSYY